MKKIKKGKAVGIRLRGFTYIGKYIKYDKTNLLYPHIVQFPCPGIAGVYFNNSCYSDKELILLKK